jgi:hypothetical protein
MNRRKQIQKDAARDLRDVHNLISLWLPGIPIIGTGIKHHQHKFAALTSFISA